MAVRATLALVVASPALAALPEEVRVGVVSYQGADAQLDPYRRVFQRLPPPDGRPLHPRLALGTYGEVLHWLMHGKVDVAVLSPGVFAEVLAGAGDGRAPFEYLATEGLPPAALPWAREGRRAAGVHFDYGSLMLVKQASPLRAPEDVARALGEGKARLLFVDRLSAAGCLAPRHALAAAGIPLGDPELTYSHAASLERLLAPRAAGEPEPVAFVFDGTSVAPGVDLAELRAVPFPGLERLSIPGDVWVARAGYPRAAALAAELRAVEDDAGQGLFRDDGVALRDRFREVMRWREEAAVRSAERVDLEEIVALLRHHARTHEAPPRLAIVLSGGGAKCSYQVGAVDAIEEHFAAVRRAGEPWLDIALVVGTSGGALNALPVAMGMTATAEGRARFSAVWESLDLRRLVRPPRWVGASLGLWWAGMVLVLAFAIRRARREPPRRNAAIAAGVAALLFVGILPFVPTAWFGHHRPLLYLGLWWSFGLPWALPGAIPWILVLHRRRRDEPLGPWPIVVLSAVLPAVTTALILFGEGTLFRGAGIEEVMRESFARLAADRADVSGSPGLAELGERLVRGGAIRRDLVVTGSGLPPADPADRYFYLAGADARGTAPPSFGRPGVDLALRPALLLDVVMGSGAIYPLFPARRLRDFPAPGADVMLVDGGFAHNSPIEAAVLWGATHVVNVEASPLAERSRGDHLLASSLQAFRFLYDQAQLIDVRNREQVVVFTLRPEAPHLSVLDFAPAHVRDAIDKGHRDASSARFVREPGPPRFRD